MKCRRLWLFLLFATLSVGLAGVEGVYRSTNSDTTLRINADGTASHRSLTSITRYKDFDHAREDKQPRQGVRTSVSRGRWTTNENKLLFEGDALVTLEIKGEPARTERMPLVISCSIETNGDLIAVPGESSARLVKQVAPNSSQSDNNTQKPVEIGFNFTLSGPGSAGDIASVRGVQLYFDELNERGGIRIAGRPAKLQMVFRDNGGDRVRAAEVSRQLISEDGVIAVIGPNPSGLAVPAAGVAEELRCPMICPWSTSSTATDEGQGGKPRNYVFRACFTDRQEMEALAGFAVKDLQAKTAAIFGSGGHGYLFEECFKQSGGEIVAFESVAANEDDSPAFGRIKSAQPDVLFFQNVSGDTIDKLEKWGIKARLLGGDGWGGAKTLIRQGKSPLDGAHYVEHFSPDSPNSSAASFKRSYRKRFGVDPDEIAALTFDSCALVIEALERANVCSRDKLRDELASLWNFRGVTGTFSYKNPPYDPIKSVFIMRVDKGETRLAKEVRP